MMKATFLKSAVLPADYPETDRPEICLVGRSNAGKSALLNSMIGGQKIAKVSGTPGKTRLINFFNVGDNYRVVDLPGYGYAAREASERKMWASMIEKYLFIRPCLVGVVLICDIRRQWAEEEDSIIQLCGQRDLASICALAKADKLNQAELRSQLKAWQSTSGHPSEFFRPVSSLTGKGVDDLEDFIFNMWIRPHLPKKGKK